MENHKCLSHAIHLAVTKTLYSKEIKNTEIWDQEECNSDDDSSNSESETSEDDMLNSTIITSSTTVEKVLTKSRKSIRTINRSPVKIDLLQEEVAKVQRKEGKPEQRLLLPL